MRKPWKSSIKMIFGNYQRKMCTGMGIESFRDQDVRAQEHRPAPEFREQVALNFDVADVQRVFRFGNRRDDLVEHDGDGSRP